MGIKSLVWIFVSSVLFVLVYSRDFCDVVIITPPSKGWLKRETHQILGRKCYSEEDLNWRKTVETGFNDFSIHNKTQSTTPTLWFMLLSPVYGRCWNQVVLWEVCFPFRVSKDFYQREGDRSVNPLGANSMAEGLLDGVRRDWSWRL